MLAESLVLSGAGAALGVVLAFVGTRVVSHIEGTTVPLLNAVQVDMTALGFSIGLAALVGIAFGLLPAFHASSFKLATALLDGSRGSTARGGRLRAGIVVGEIAAVCVLLMGAGLLAWSLRQVLEVRPGYSTENLLTVRVDPRHDYSKPASVYAAYFDNIASEVRAIPGVQQVGFSDALPLGDNFGWRRWDAALDGAPKDERVFPLVRLVDDGYLAAMQIPVRAGRAFSTADADGAEPVIIVNEALATKLWPGMDAIGRYMKTNNVPRRVVGVVANTRYFGLDRDADIEMYLPMRQVTDYATVDVVIRSAVPVASLTRSVRAALRRADPGLPIPAFHTMQQLVDRSVFARRFVVLLVGGFALFGLLLASLGIYAVISYSVAQRRQELGIRLALGASPRQLLANVLGETGGPAALGIIIGVPLSLIAARAIR